MPAASAAEAKVCDSTRWLSGPSPHRLGNKPARVAMGPPHGAQLVENRLGQQHQPLLVAFANDTQHLVGTVDGADLQRGGFADAQAARIHGGEARTGDRVADVAAQLPAL